jgi:hypothetical protein
VLLNPLKLTIKREKAEREKERGKTEVPISPSRAQPWEDI